MKLSIIRFAVFLLLGALAAPHAFAYQDRLKCTGDLTLDQVAKCIEAGIILRRTSLSEVHLSASVKRHLGRLTRCEGRAADQQFKQCFADYLTNREATVQTARMGVECWREINEDAFNQCMGWVRPRARAPAHRIHTATFTNGGADDGLR